MSSYLALPLAMVCTHARARVLASLPTHTTLSHTIPCVVWLVPNLPLHSMDRIDDGDLRDLVADLQAFRSYRD